MELNYPLRFAPLFRRYLWGGRRLASALNKPIGEGTDYAESWEVVDHDADQSIVAAGPLAGWPLKQVVGEFGRELFGVHYPQASFPLLFKFLDAQQPLSVQVHPNDDYAQRMTPPDLGKTEAWVVLEATPGSLLYAGLKRGFDRAELARQIERGRAEQCLHRFEPQPGECIFIPAGVPHALGAGLVIAEIQQASDTTFRLFDWNRVGADGKPRALHIEQGLDVINYRYGPVDPQEPHRLDDQCDQLVHCEKFVLCRWQLDGVRKIPADNRFRILAVLSGELSLPHDPLAKPLRRGATALLPAAMTPCNVTANGPTTVLEIYLPTS